jgi:hypothetical protein
MGATAATATTKGTPDADADTGTPPGKHLHKGLSSRSCRLICSSHRTRRQDVDAADHHPPEEGGIPLEAEAANDGLVKPRSLPMGEAL